MLKRNEVVFLKYESVGTFTSTRKEEGTWYEELEELGSFLGTGDIGGHSGEADRGELFRRGIVERDHFGRNVGSEDRRQEWQYQDF